MISTMEEDGHTNHNGVDHPSGLSLEPDISTNSLSHNPDSPGVNGIQALPPGNSKYAQLLSIIEEMSKDVRPTYAGSKTSTERIKKGIVHARILVRECIMETERSAQIQ